MAPRPENKRLDVLVGRWRSEGRTVPADGEPPVRIAGSDVYEWLAGGFFLVHHVDVRMGGDTVEVIEMIGPYDPATGTYPMRSFDDQGNFTTMHAAVDDRGVWTFTGGAERATLTIAEDGSTMSARWERTDDGSTWLHWMDMTFAREA
ncbi:hypothetical protein GCM10010411_02400 [Actinomadura fulvescens]|uniref:DUF1579 domain-containing protein n=2 Tax=Actinomadura fulvescens TaxID=46160 RepID=A0ABN3P920_9ACTN